MIEKVARALWDIEVEATFETMQKTFGEKMASAMVLRLSWEAVEEVQRNVYREKARKLVATLGLSEPAQAQPAQGEVPSSPCRKCGPVDALDRATEAIR